jgi:phage FluMu protein Com
MELNKCKSCDKELPLHVGKDHTQCVFCGTINNTESKTTRVKVSSSGKKKSGGGSDGGVFSDGSSTLFDD